MAKKIKLKKINKLPQIYQKLTAKIHNIFLFCFSIILLLYLIFLLYSQTNPKMTFLNNLLPNLDKKHYQIALIKKLLTLSQLDLAQNQININLAIFQNDHQITSLQDNLKETRNTPKKLIKEIEKYENLIEIRPNYRDGLLKLAILHYQLYQDEKATQYLKKTLDLDPNFPPALKLQKLL